MGWFADCFADLPDPRCGNAQRHDLFELLTIALAATLSGAESCVNFELFARSKEAFLRANSSISKAAFRATTPSRACSGLLITRPLRLAPSGTLVWGAGVCRAWARRMRRGRMRLSQSARALWSRTSLRQARTGLQIRARLEHGDWQFRRPDFGRNCRFCSDKRSPISLERDNCIAAKVP
jgi:hypothetical protein